MFASKEYIDISRDFVCVRIDSYESEAHQKWVRNFLNGRFENSVFCVLTPDGREWVTSADRGPQMVLGHRDPVGSMERILLEFSAKEDSSNAVVQDFHSFRQALNVAAADQRVLMLVNAPAEKEKELRESLRAVANDERIVGRFHIDFDQGDDWKKSIDGTKPEHGIVLINPGEFGQSGKVMKQVSLDASADELVAALTTANGKFASSTEKKVYSEHVAKGRAKGVYFESAVPYGEDRDGDGEIDRRGGPRRGRPSR